MSRAAALLFAASFTACTGAGSPPASDDPSLDAKEDSVAAASVDAKLAPMLAFLRDDKNLVTQLGPEGTDANNVKKTIKVVRYTDFGKAVDAAARPIARKYLVGAGSNLRRANGLVDMIAVGDMYVQVKTGYGDDAFVDKLVAASKRSAARSLNTTLLPEAALITADHASTTSTGNYVVVLGDLASGQAIVMTLEYEVY